MNLYEVTCGLYTYYKVAKTKDEAVEKVKEEKHLEYLPFEAKEIDLEGYKLVKR